MRVKAIAIGIAKSLGEDAETVKRALNKLVREKKLERHIWDSGGRGAFWFYRIK